MNPSPRNALSFIGEEAKKVAAKLIIYFVLGLLVLMLTPIRDRLWSIWSSPSTLEEIQRDLRDLRSDIQRATGEDRVIRQPSGLTYIMEPVVRGQPAVMSLVLQRTRLGANCRFVGGTSLFTDTSGLTLAGGPIVLQGQLSTEVARLRVDLEMPRAILSGRVEVYLALEYNCNGVITFDRTDTVTFQLFEPEG